MKTIASLIASGEAERLVAARDFDEGKHPRDDKGRFAESGADVDAGTTVYRGGDNQDWSEEWGEQGVFVSLKKAGAIDYGPVSKYKLTTSLKALDLTKPSAGNKAFVSELEGPEVAGTNTEYYETSAEVFLQMNPETIALAKRAGFNAVQLGYDIFIIGKPLTKVAKKS